MDDTDRPLSFDDVLGNVRALRSSIEKQAAEIEAARAVPKDLVEALRRCGVFRMYTPRSHGGLELDLRESLEVISELAAADGSVGWLSMIGCATPWFLCNLPRKIFDSIYASTPDVIHAGSSLPFGTAERVDGGYRVTGRWPFASGCQHADWMLGMCVITETGIPLPGPEPGVPLTSFAVCPAREWQIEDTWRVAGLKGTGSHHIVLTDHFVSDDFVYDITAPRPCVTGPYYNAIAPFIKLSHSALALGIAEGARANLLTMVKAGKRQFRAASPMRDSAIFQYEFARADANVRAARAFLDSQARKVWELAQGLRLSNEEHGPESGQAAVWITAACAQSVDTFYSLAGGRALYESSPLQRRLRDMHTATQHVQVQARNYETIGRTLLGRSTE